MKAISELSTSLNRHFHWNKARIDCFTKMLFSLFAVKTVNLREIAAAFASSAQLDSRYKRLKRFFAQCKMEMGTLAAWMFTLFFNDSRSFYLVMDRTNWYVGKQKINIFMLGIAYEGMAIPLCWTLLPKAGNSCFLEQKTLIGRFIKQFGKERIAGLLADREFASGKLFRWLTKERIPFYIRIKEGSVVCIKRKTLWKAKKLFKDVGCKRRQSFSMAIDVLGAKVYLAGSRSERGELMIIATNKEPENAVAIYLRRWEIENLFQSLKGRGFRFEETHITKLERIEKLMALLAIGVCWAHKVGEWRAVKKPIVLNRYRESLRPQYSYFRYGVDFIRDAILQMTTTKKALKQAVKQILFPPLEPKGALL